MSCNVETSLFQWQNLCWDVSARRLGAPASPRPGHAATSQHKSCCLMKIPAKTLTSLGMAEESEWLLSRLHFLSEEAARKNLSDPLMYPVVLEAGNIANALDLSHEVLTEELGLTNRSEPVKTMKNHDLVWSLDSGTAASIPQLVFDNARLYVSNQKLGQELMEKQGPGLDG